MRIEQRGWSKLVGIMLSDELYGDAWRNMFTEAVKMMHSQAEARVPRNKGHLASRLEARMDARPVPSWGLVQTDVPVYPYVLEAGKRRAAGQGWKFMSRSTGDKKRGRKRTRQLFSEATITSRYSSGPKKGRTTRKWLSGARAYVARNLRKMLKEAARNIENKWEKSV